jgi:hypothetical protein
MLKNLVKKFAAAAAELQVFIFRAKTVEFEGELIIAAVARSASQARDLVLQKFSENNQRLESRIVSLEVVEELSTAGIRGFDGEVMVLLPGGKIHTFK